MILINQLKISLEKFAKTINNENIRLVYHINSPEATPSNCFDNVFDYIEKHGGNIKFGWTFNYRENEEYGDYFFATHHAVWHAPDGSLLDITPFHTNNYHHPISTKGKVHFLPDNKSELISHNGIFTSRPLKFFPLQDNEKLKGYIKTLIEEEASYYKTQFNIDINEV